MNQLGNFQEDGRIKALQGQLNDNYTVNCCTFVSGIKICEAGALHTDCHVLPLPGSSGTTHSFAESVLLLVQRVRLHYHLLQLMGGVTVDAVLLERGYTVIISTSYEPISCSLTPKATSCCSQHMRTVQVRTGDTSFDPKTISCRPQTHLCFSETVSYGSQVARTDTHRRYKGWCHLLALDLLPVQALKEWVWYQVCNFLQPFSLIRVQQLREERGKLMYYSVKELPFGCSSACTAINV